ncbi:MAG: hypothetical protein ACI9SK_002051 [Zhongshania sp.]|jgi:hypothetical protein
MPIEGIGTVCFDGVSLTLVVYIVTFFLVSAPRI